MSKNVSLYLIKKSILAFGGTYHLTKESKARFVRTKLLEKMKKT